MNAAMFFLFLFGVLTCRVAQVASEEQCFSFQGDSYLLFSLDGFYNNRDKVHYEFQFRTSALNGVLMYARGAYGDNEALYIRGGNLHYHLFNSAPSGIERQFGAYFVSTERVDTNAWITVHLYRSYPLLDSFLRPLHNKTGFEFELGGSLRSYVDHRAREGIDISSNIYFGGYSYSLSRTVGNFTGDIKGIKEEKNRYVFENPTLNYKSLVVPQCDP